MKKILTIIFLLLASLTQAQKFNSFSEILYFFYEGVSYDADAQAYFDVATGLTTARKDTVNQFILKLKDSLAIASLDDFFVNLTIPHLTQANSLVDIISLTSQTVVGSVTFAADRGFTSDGTTGYITTSVISTTTALISQNDVSLGGYVRVNPSGNSLKVLGAGNLGGGVHLWLQSRIDNMFARFNDATTLSGTTSASPGMFIITRRGATDVEGYKNGISRLTGATASVAETNVAIWVLCYNANGVPTNIYLGQVPIWFISAKVSDDQALKITRCIEWYLDAIGAGIIP